MEPLSSVSTIVRIAQDMAAAVTTVSRNKQRCQKLAKRVQGIGDLLRELEPAAAGATLTQRLLDRLQETLRHALRLVRSCQDSSPAGVYHIAGGRVSDEFDQVDREIDGCLLDLGVSNRIIVARLEKKLHHQNEDADTETETLRIGVPHDDNVKRSIRRIRGASTKDKFKVTDRSGAVDIPSLLDQLQKQLNCNLEAVTPAAADAGLEKYDVKDQDKKANSKSAAVECRSAKQRHSSSVELKKEKAAPTTMVGVNQATPDPYVYMPFKLALVPAGDPSSMCHPPFPPAHGDCRRAAGNFTAIGVPLHTVTAGVPDPVPPPSYGYGYWPYAHGRSSGGCCHHDAAGSSHLAAPYNYNHYSQHPNMFSNDNPNGYCSIM
ncbi:hypothetical protein QOZ80_5AG0377670 [Eleusine coracana subsp. coracana]|nr:hypothetical protein QOZ80_5AG0377670 [Eleusine coracana subsp. coracana]